MAYVTIRSPFNSKYLGTVTEHTVEDTIAAIERARHIRLPSPAERSRILLRFHDLVLRRRDEILDLLQDETGKNRASAFEEVMDVAIQARHCAYRAPKLLRSHRAKPALPLLTSTRVDRRPVGVVGIIAPWNYPFTLAVSDALAAIAMGNRVVLKPDSLTPLTALKAQELLEEAGMPEGVFQVVTGRGSVVGDAIARNADFLMFTGSTQTGRSLAAIAGERLIGFSAELGGKNPLIVAPDAPMPRAVSGTAAACFSNSGQLCVSIERLYVHQDIAETFLPALVAHIQEMRIGPGHSWATDMGSLISEEHCNHVASMVDEAVAKGARVLVGGTKLPELGPSFYAPTLLTDVPADAELYREEVFGPVVNVEVVESLDEAIIKANDTDYGLNSSVWASAATGRKVAARLESGTVNVNEGFAATWASTGAPMGGWKASGVGRRHGDHGLTKFTEERSVAVQRLTGISNNELVPPKVFATTIAATLRAGKRLLR